MFLLFIAATGSAQIRVTSVNVGPVYGEGFSLKKTFTSVDGLGIESHVTLQLHEWVGLQFTVGYRDLKVDQADPTTNWNWGFYLQPYRGLISTQLRDSTYKATFEPNQRLYVVPVEIALVGMFPLLNGLELVLGGGGGLQLYQRHLWVHESWSKYYPSIGYRFEYDFNNDAGTKVGTVYTLAAAARLEYALTSALGASLHLSAVDYLRAQNEQAFREFPMRLLLSAGLNLSFRY